MNGWLGHRVQQVLGGGGIKRDVKKKTDKSRQPEGSGEALRSKVKGSGWDERI